LEKNGEIIKKVGQILSVASYTVALTGAGLSTESGIRDFRGPNGIWKTDPEAEKKAYQSFAKFKRNPKEHWIERLTTSGLLGDLSVYEPNRGHHALVELESLGIIRTVITQNVDNLHGKAGSKNLIEYHGNYSKLRCLNCASQYKRSQFNLDEMLRDDLLPPICPKCGQALKVDIVLFNEPIPDAVATESISEARKCDVMLVCGTSAKVYPFADLPYIAKQQGGAIIIEINYEPTPLTRGGLSDYFIQGSVGEYLTKIVQEIKSKMT
jgi:NAD-dependent deacetylase